MTFRELCPRKRHNGFCRSNNVGIRGIHTRAAALNRFVIKRFISLLAESVDKTSYFFGRAPAPPISSTLADSSVAINGRNRMQRTIRFRPRTLFPEMFPSITQCFQEFSSEVSVNPPNARKPSRWREPQTRYNTQGVYNLNIQ